MPVTIHGHMLFYCIVHALIYIQPQHPLSRHTLEFSFGCGYPHDGRADKDSYPHDCRADNTPYQHDRRADKNPYRHAGI